MTAADTKVARNVNCYGRFVKGDEARQRIQKLLVTGDNRLKQGVDPAKARQSYEQALEAAHREGADLFTTDGAEHLYWAADDVVDDQRRERSYPAHEAGRPVLIMHGKADDVIAFWAPSLGLSWSFNLDGLGLLFAVPGATPEAVTPPPETVMKALEAADIKVVPTGLKHGTVTAIESREVVKSRLELRNGSVASD